MPRRLGSRLRRNASRLRRRRRRLAGHLHVAGGRLRVQGRAERRLDRELRPSRPAGRRQHPARAARAGERQVLLRPQEPLGHGQQELRDRRRARKLPVRARLSGRLGSGLPPLLAPGSGRQRDLLLRDVGAPPGLVRDEGGDQRGLGRELRSGRRARRGQYRVHRPGRQRDGHVHLRRDVARPDDRRRDPPGRPGRPGRALALRPRAQGLPRYRPQQDLEGLVHGRERRPQRRLLPDGRQHQRRDPPVRRHRRLHVHRPADAGHDLRGGGASRLRRHGVHRDGDCEERQVSDRDRLRDRSRRQHRGHERQVPAGDRRTPAVRALRPDGERQRGRRRGERRRRPGHDRRFDGRSRARCLRSGHRNERGEPRLRAARLRSARRPVLGGHERLRGRGERRARPARRVARADDDVRRGNRRERRPDGEGRAQGRRERRRQGHSRARLRRLPGRGRRRGRGLARAPASPGRRRPTSTAGASTTAR